MHWLVMERLLCLGWTCDRFAVRLSRRRRDTLLGLSPLEVSPQRLGIDADHPCRDRLPLAIGQQPVREVELFRRQRARPADMLPPPPRRLHACPCTFA